MALLVAGPVLAGAGIMAAVAGVATTPEQAGNVQAIIAVLLGLLGGAFFQVAQGNNVLTNLAVLTPHHWFLRGSATWPAVTARPRCCRRSVPCCCSRS